MNPICKHRRGVSGFTLIEMLVALILLVGLMAMLGEGMRTYSEGLANQAAAQHAKTVRDAAQSYIADNYAALVSAATATTPATIAPATLAAGGYLPSGFNTTNGFGQSFTVKVIEPTTNKLEAVVITTGGDTLTGQNLRKIAQLVGVDGGYVEAAPVASGAFGGWNRDLTPFGGAVNGHIVTALFVADATDQDDYLHRSATPGRPELNRMNAAIDMNGNNISGAGAVTANTANAKLRHTNGYFTIDSFSTATYGTGSGLLWWNANAANLSLWNAAGGYGNFEAGNLAAGGTITAGGDITAIGGNLSGQEAYVNGWFRTRGNSGWYSQAWNGGWYMQDPYWVRSYADKNVYTGGELRGGSVRSVGRLYADEAVQIGGVGWENGGCSPNGLVARDNSGHLMSCVGGIWRSYAPRTSVYTSPNQTCGLNGPATSAAVAWCPAGSTVTGGGYWIASYNPTAPNRSNAPDVSAPYGTGGWITAAGGANGYTCFVSYAVCEN